MRESNLLLASYFPVVIEYITRFSRIVMSDIFISYASEDRERARTLAEALAARGWSVWWDRKIPLGKSFDAVIEEALAEAKCVVVLWSGASVTSEWVRNEASEGRRRDILVPVFIEPVAAPLAFRLLNGANLSDWDPESEHPEFDKLAERITELLGQTRSRGHDVLPKRDDRVSKRTETEFYRWLRSPVVPALAALLIGGAALGGYFWRARERGVPGIDKPINAIGTALKTGKLDPSAAGTDLEKSINDLAAIFGGAIPATSVAKAFHVPDLGLRIAFLSPEQSASTLGALPPGAVIMEVESGRPIAQAGLQAGDVVLSIAGRKIGSEDDLRQAIAKLGPGKTTYSYRRGSDTRTVAIECPKCNAE